MLFRSLHRSTLLSPGPLAAMRCKQLLKRKLPARRNGNASATSGHGWRTRKACANGQPSLLKHVVLATPSILDVSSAFALRKAQNSPKAIPIVSSRAALSSKATTSAIRTTTGPSSKNSLHVLLRLRHLRLPTAMVALTATTSCKQTAYIQAELRGTDIG